MAWTHETADVDPSATLGAGTRVWHLAQVRERARLGRRCVVGRGAYLGAGVTLGDDVKVQNHAMVYEPATIADAAFIGPAAILTNDRVPRSVTPSGLQKRADDWKPEGVRVGVGASVGAGAVVMAGVAIGDWAMVGAGAVVTRDVPRHALVVGTPGRIVGWVGRAGVRLVPVADGELVCPETREKYRVSADGLEPAS